MSRSHLLETDGFNQLAEGRGGYYIYNRNDIYVGQAIEKYGEYCALEIQILTQLCAPGDFVFEVGANIGAHTVEIARHVGRRGRVLAFEPQRLAFQTLCANAAINSLENVDCHWSALGRTIGAVPVPDLDPHVPNNFCGLSLSDAPYGDPVQCRMLDEFTSVPRLALIKIDVEGMEADVLEGGRQLIAKYKPNLYVENDRVQKSDGLLRLIFDLGYRMYWDTPALFNPENFYGETENIYPGTMSVNMVCVHRDAPINVVGLAEITDFSSHPLVRSNVDARGAGDAGP